MLERSWNEYSDILLALWLNSFELCLCVCVCVCVLKERVITMSLQSLENHCLYIKVFADSQNTEQAFVAICLAFSGSYLQGDFPVQVRSIRKIPKPQEPFLSFPHLPNQIFWLFLGGVKCKVEAKVKPK